MNTIYRIEHPTGRGGVGQVAPNDSYGDYVDIGILMIKAGLYAPGSDNKNTKGLPNKAWNGRFWFTELGWKTVGALIAGQLRINGYRFKVRKESHKDPQDFIYRDDLQLSIKA